MYQTYVTRFTKQREWYEVKIISIDKEVKIKDKYDRKKFVFEATCEENGNTNTCVCWTRLDLCVGDKLQIHGHKNNSVFIIRDFKRLSTGGEKNGD